MKKCAPLGQSSSPVVSKRQDSSFFPSPKTSLTNSCEWCDDKSGKIDDQSLEIKRKFKMPGLLRLNSVGEVSSSCSLLDGNKSRLRSSSMLTKVESPLRQSNACTSHSIPPAALPFPVMETLKFFSPSHQSTPNFKKSESYPGTFHKPASSPEPMFYKSNSKHRMLFLNNSVPAPCDSHRTMPVVDTQKLHTSLSTPALWRGNCFNPSIFRQYSMYDYKPPTALNSDSPCSGPVSGSKVSDSPTPEASMEHMALGKQSEEQFERDIPESRGGRVKNTPEVEEKGVSNASCELNGLVSESSFSEEQQLQRQAASVPSDAEKLEKEPSETMETSNDCNVKTNSSEGMPTPDRTFVLFQRRKCTKKGRPSAKKQKKRKREKLKQSEAVNGSKPSLVISISVNEDGRTERNCSETADVLVSYDSDSDGIGENLNNEITSSREVANSPEVPKLLQKDYTQTSLACFFISGADDESDSQTEESDGDDSWWSEEEDEERARELGVNLCLGGALSLDNMFKKKEPTLKRQTMNTNSVGVHSPIGSPGNLTVLINSPGSSTHDDSFQFSFTDSDTLDLSSSQVLQSLQESFSDFSPGLSLDSILGVVSVQAPSECQSPTADRSDHSAKLGEINARWDGHYPSAGFRSCSGAGSVISSSAVRVHFAENSALETVHEVGTEDRRGTWHIDGCRLREKFDRVGKVLSPILDSKHREAVFKRNSDLEAAMYR